MSDSKVNVSGGGVSAAALLGTAFVVLKLCGVIDWSWWWVTCPFWAGFAFFVIVAAGALACAAIAALVLAFLNRRK